ncbi:Spo0E like sporulation regulatory protein [Clostridium aceticum]|uniref:Spo0E like sporulation regulatory protein n=1 Tax=Clostridium aceticum TaxID=84022 RepID=A0A0G3WCJ8_9CLOT|nr:aspartyl-phosphate phosphatase Spo0E family protein [Clostridium aceticum]AKL96053.1 Spo0E like sporulation regulatory protein [Clostridium aceticum]
MDESRRSSTIEIEELRKKLNEELIRKEFIDDEILHISQALDILISQYVKEKVLLK